MAYKIIDRTLDLRAPAWLLVGKVFLIELNWILCKIMVTTMQLKKYTILKSMSLFLNFYG